MNSSNIYSIRFMLLVGSCQRSHKQTGIWETKPYFNVRSHQLLWVCQKDHLSYETKAVTHGHTSWDSVVSLTIKMSDETAKKGTSARENNVSKSMCGYDANFKITAIKHTEQKTTVKQWQKNIVSKADAWRWKHQEQKLKNVNCMRKSSFVWPRGQNKKTVS
jgi:hypothetical protein